MNKFLLSVLIILLLISISYQKEEEENPSCYGVIFDAGSSSTKLNIYTWPCRQIDTVPMIDTQKTEQSKKKPGIATYADKIDEISTYLQPLLDYANNLIPEDQRKTSPIMLFGTAGLRLIPEKDQKNILNKVKEIFKKSGYLYEEAWVRVISGQEEGGFMWTSINYLENTLSPSPLSPALTSVTVDLGGASTQIAFGPKVVIDDQYQVNVQFPNFNNYNLYSISYLGYGNDQARNSVIDEYGTWSADKKSVSTPCYYKGYIGKYGSNDEVELQGTGNPQECQEQIKKFFKLDKCSEAQKYFGCGIDGAYQPKIQSGKEIYAVSGVTNAAAFFNLDTKPYTPKQMLDQYNTLCSKSWEEIQQEYKDNDYIDTTCFLGLYSSQLMISGYNIDQNRGVRSPSKIQGVEPTWTLGAMFYSVSQVPCQETSPLCKIAKMLYGDNSSSSQQQQELFRFD